jgi:hypothetical protein
MALEVSGSIESNIAIKHRSQNKGPQVDLWPGPYSGVSEVLLYVIVEVPYCVLMRCTILSQIVPRHWLAI